MVNVIGAACHCHATRSAPRVLHLYQFEGHIRWHSQGRKKFYSPSCYKIGKREEKESEGRTIKSLLKK